MNNTICHTNQAYLVQIAEDPKAGLLSCLGGAEHIYTRDRFVNLTPMCFAFGKCPSDFLNWDETLVFFKEWAVQHQFNLIRLVVLLDSEIWVPQALAIRCAAWLSREFAVWFLSSLCESSQGETLLLSPVPDAKCKADALRAIAAEMSGSQVVRVNRSNRRVRYEPEQYDWDDPVEGTSRIRVIRAMAG